jgi:TetR/AcrR family transcriptional regulator, transcriptional repressor for nem operon
MPRAINLEVRERVVTTAYKLFVERGYKSVSMDDVAKAAGLKKANLFHYYPSKETLGLAVLEKHRWLFLERVNTEFASDLDDPIEAVAKMYTALAERFGGPDNDTPSVVANIVVEMAGSNRSLQTHIAEDFAFWVNHLGTFLQTWKHRGYFRSDLDSRQAAMTCISLVQGAMVFWLATRDHEIFEAVAQSARQFLGNFKTESK